MEYGSTEEQLVLDFFAPADVSAVHADEAEYHGKETQSKAAHEQPAHSLYERCEDTQGVKVKENQFNFKAFVPPLERDRPDLGRCWKWKLCEQLEVLF